MIANYRYNRPAKLDLVKAPKLSVAVIIACRDGQEKLDLLLASLVAQKYPTRLISVYVIDDGSSNPLKLPTIRPSKTKLIYFKNSQQSWGKTQAVNHLAKQVKQDVIWCIDADMVVEPDHLAHMMKWHHDSGDYLVLGWKRFVSDWTYTPQKLLKELKLGNFASLHSKSEGKDSWENLVAATNQLQEVSLESFRALVGATFSISRNNWLKLGGYNPLFKTAEDTELGWRVLMAGLRMVPEKNAKSWHLGISTVDQNQNSVITHNQPLLANYIPALKYLRNRSPIIWQIPEKEVIIDCRKMKFETFKQVINQFISDTTAQARFKLLAQWKTLEGRYKVTDDPNKEFRAIKRFVLSDDRFEFINISSEKQLDIHQILEFAHSDATPFIYFIEGNPDQRIIYEALRRKMVKSKNGLEGMVDALDQRAFILYAPALNRARTTGGNIYKNMEIQWGVSWAEVGEFDFTKRLSITNVFPMIALGLRSFMKIRRPKQFKNFVKRIFVVLKNTRSY